MVIKRRTVTLNITVADNLVQSSGVTDMRASIPVAAQWFKEMIRKRCH
jgi:hypothetical protein